MKKTKTKPASKKTRTIKAKAPAKPETVLILRTCAANMSSSNGFVWPKSGPVECPDWKPTNECGNGLHGWLWGSGNWNLKNSDTNALWLVVEVEKSSLIDLVGKVKFPRGNVIGCFSRWADAMAMIRARLGEMVTDNRTTTTKVNEHASATGNSGHASATGDYGHASATGDSGHASATGDSGHASATGNYGWSIVGRNGKVKAGEKGALTLLWWDQKSERYRVAVGYVGENGIKPNVWYSVNDKGNIFETKE